MLYKNLFFIVLVLVALLTACSDEKLLLDEQAKLRVIEHFEQDKNILEIKVNKFELFQEKNGKNLYMIDYSLKPVNPDDFTIAGSRVKGKDGWINAQHFVEFEKNGELTFSTSP